MIAAAPVRTLRSARELVGPASNSFASLASAMLPIHGSLKSTTWGTPRRAAICEAATCESCGGPEEITITAWSAASCFPLNNRRSRIQFRSVDASTAAEKMTRGCSDPRSCELLDSNTPATLATPACSGWCCDLRNRSTRRRVALRHTGARRGMRRTLTLAPSRFTRLKSAGAPAGGSSVRTLRSQPAALR